MKYFIFISLSFILLCSCAVVKNKNIVYYAERNLKLDVYSPKKVDKPKEVLVFMHGGNWVRGKKSIYPFLGKGFAKKNIVTVIVNYRLSPKGTNDSMATNAALAVKWVKENISLYNGDTNHIFISGHSAGAQLAALIATDNTYFKKLNMQNPIKGTILIDPFGLDMYTYLTHYHGRDSLYYPVFSNNPETWKKATPSFYFNKEMPPFLILLGTKTNDVIIKGSYDFLKALQPYQPNTKLILVKGKRHVGMIFQFLNRRVKSYKDIIDFIHQESKSN